MENKKTDKTVGILLVIFVVLWICYHEPITLYSSYAILMSYSLVKLLFSKSGGIIEMYPQTKQLFIFGCFCAISIFWSVDKSAAFDSVKFLMPCIIMVIVITNYFVKIQNFDRIISVIAIMGVALSLYVISQEGGLQTMYNKSVSSMTGVDVNYARVGDTVADLNFISERCVYSAVVLLYYALFQKKKYCYFIALIPIIISTLSASRGGTIILFFGISLLFYFYQKRDKTIKKYLLILFGAILIIPIILYIFSTDLMHTLTQRFSDMFEVIFSGDDSRDGSTRTRLLFITEGLKQFVNAPVVGIGIGCSPYLYAARIGRAYFSHNDYIEQLVCGGFLGFVFYYRMFIVFIKRYKNILKNCDDHRYIIGFILLLMFLLNNMTIVTYHGNVATYILFILWISQIEIYKAEHEAKELEKTFEENSYFR